jgi:hypothetical protein
MPRRIFIHCVLIAFLAVAAFDVAAGIEHWPFSNYPMYDGVQGRNYSWLELYGVSAFGDIPLPVKYLQPFNEGRFASVLGRLPSSSLESALQEAKRIYGQNGGTPAISGTKLFRVTWDLEAGAAPLRKELLREAH